MNKKNWRAHRLAPTQCAPNMFRILGSVDALNEKMGLNLTHHDVNWVYNFHHLKGQGNYLKTRYLEVRLISCLPDSNKGMNKDFLIISRGVVRWPPLPDERGESKLITWKSPLLPLICSVPISLCLCLQLSFSFDLCPFFWLIMFF